MSRTSQPVRIGVIGVTGRGGLSRHWHKPGGKSVVVAGADINEEYLREFKQKIGESVFVTTDYRRLLERDDIDAIAVTS
ncbi:gfo/Idh/MocA family oxidoreductase, partial [Candidatus Bathyarchaeota archaeon]